ncbi:MAG: glycosyltransferase family 8 protein [Bacteroidales bacterium]|nr:glycosyltransferase family 8 protein [Bacteroidales bacterium]
MGANTETTKNVVLISDDSFAGYAMIMLCSLFENNNYPIKVFVLTDELSEENTELFITLSKKYNNSLEILHPGRILREVYGIDINDLPANRWNPIVYYKLTIPLILPREVGRCLFLDVDLIVNDQILELFNYKLEDHMVIAACDDNGWSRKHASRLGLPMGSYYINSGVMLCDVDKWRLMEQQDSVINTVKKNAPVLHNEQDVIALYFKNNITLLPIKWNMTTFYYRREPLIDPIFKDELSSSKKHPSIIHFCDHIKPWFSDCDHPFGYLYKKYYLKYCAVCDITPREFERFYGEHNTIQRFRYSIRLLLNRYNIRKDPYYLTLE